VYTYIYIINREKYKIQNMVYYIIIIDFASEHPASSIAIIIILTCQNRE